MDLFLLAIQFWLKFFTGCIITLLYWDNVMGKNSLSDKIFNAIMKLNKFGFYKWIYKHPKSCIAILALTAAIILYVFVGFIVKYVV
jgi:hypothetical protein